MQNRKNWIDWTKALGMLLIVWGHCFPPMLTSFVYAFSVPVFFFISGYLSKEETSKSFYSKLYRCLFLPYLLLSLIKSAGYMIHHISDGSFLWSLFGIAAGFHHFNEASACGNLWFIYTLMIVKIISHLVHYRKKSLIIIALISYAGAAIYGASGYEIPWAIPAVLSAMPLFALGYFVKALYSGRIDSFTNSISSVSYIKLSASAALSLLMVLFISSYNGPAWMYMGLYGNNILLFTISSLLGTFAILCIAFMLNKIRSEIVITISTGTILILVFHRELLHPLLKWINNGSFNDISVEIIMFTASVLVLMIFVPAIKIVERYIPILIGNRSSKK